MELIDVCLSIPSRDFCYFLNKWNIYKVVHNVHSKGSLTAHGWSWVFQVMQISSKILTDTESCLSLCRKIEMHFIWPSKSATSLLSVILWKLLHNGQLYRTHSRCEFTAHIASDQAIEGIFVWGILMVTCYVRHAPLHSPPAPLSPLAVALPDRGTM